MKKYYLALLLCFAGFMSLSAATVSVLVVEAGLPSGSGCTPSAEIWESGMMDAFFEAGHIVSNAPCYQIAAFINKVSGALPSDVGQDFDQARLGGVDFFVLILLNYHDGDSGLPKDVFIRVFRVSSGDLLYETSLNARVWGSKDEEFLDAKRNAGKVVPQLAKKG